MDQGIILSIILITYNHEKYIADAIERILVQPIKVKYELIIGDDCSTDGTGEILESYKRKYPDIISIVYHKENVGAARNIYDLLMITKGQYVLRLEGDNYWEKNNHIQKMIEFLEKHEEYIGVSYQSTTIDEESGEVLFVSKVDPRIKNNIATIKDYEKSYNIGAFLYRNFYRDEKADFSIIYTSGRMIAESTLELLVLERGNVYTTNENWEVSRGGKRNSDASNYQTITKRKDILEEWLHNAEILQEYRPDLSFWSKKVFPAGEMLWDAFREQNVKEMIKVLKRFKMNERIELLINLMKRIVKRAFLKIIR